MHSSSDWTPGSGLYMHPRGGNYCILLCHYFFQVWNTSLDIRKFEWALITWALRRPSPSSRSPWSCSWSPLSFVELDLNSEDRLTKTPLAAPGSSTTRAHQQTDWVSEIVFHKGRLRHLLVRIIYTMEEKVSQSRLLSWHRKRKKQNIKRAEVVWRTSELYLVNNKSGKACFDGNLAGKLFDKIHLNKNRSLKIETIWQVASVRYGGL